MPPKETIGDANFNKVVTELKKLHENYPTIRIGSLIQQALDIKKRKENFNLNDVSSKELLACLIDYSENLKKRDTHGKK